MSSGGTCETTDSSSARLATSLAISAAFGCGCFILETSSLKNPSLRPSSQPHFRTERSIPTNEMTCNSSSSLGYSVTLPVTIGRQGYAMIQNFILCYTGEDYNAGRDRKSTRLNSS